MPDAVNPYLHAKALLLMAGVPSQEMRVSTMRQPAGTLAYTLQNASVALYAKLNGVPWTVDHHLPIADEIVVGLGIAELAASRYHDRQRYMGVTTVFRGDGNYLLGSLSRECSFEEYPQMLRASVQDVLTEIKQRNGWKPGDTVRIVCHTTLPMRERHLDRLIADCVAAVGAEQNVEFAFLTVGDRQPFTMLDPGQPGKQARGKRKGIFAPERGTIVQISPAQRLLAITGPDLIKRAGAPLPRQLHVRLHLRVHVPRPGLPDRAGPEVHLLVLALHPAGRPAGDHLLLRAHGGPAGAPARRAGLVARAAEHPPEVQPLVPVMHPVIANGLAAELDRLAAAVRQDRAWPSPAAGFSCWLARQHGMPPFVPPPSAAALTADTGRLHEAPVLASHGYLLSADDGATAARLGAWTAAAARLRGRDPLPGDRASFFFRPVELLGTRPRCRGRRLTLTPSRCRGCARSCPTDDPG